MFISLELDVSPVDQTDKSEGQILQSVADYFDGVTISADDVEYAIFVIAADASN